MSQVFEAVHDDTLEPVRPTKTLSGRWFLEMRQPMVYVWSREDTVLYVGLASEGLARPLAPSHHRLTRIALRPTDDISLYYCKSAAHAAELEKRLILTLRPKLNGPKKRREPDAAKRRLDRLVEGVLADVMGTTK